ncbi:MAG: hypothetical protein IJC88_01395 [Oscillospiraceae bacterium]|nr:hypothetical protein [Oscillospiraceae bacterium]
MLRKKELLNLHKNIRVAICGDLPTARRTLREIGVSKIDQYDDAINACFKLRSGETYHLILVYAPQGEGLVAEMPYKIECEGEWKSVPIKLLNEPPCESALLELELAVQEIASKQN